MKVAENKGSSKEPSCALKAITMIAFALLFFGINLGGNYQEAISFDIVNGNDNLFLSSDNKIVSDLEIVVSQDNTLYAVAPISMPTTQVLGVKSDSLKCREDIISYKVQSGDTLSGIASRFGISTDTLVWANDLNRSSLRQGQDLIILPVSGVFHIVKSGESLSSIATRYKADREEIVVCNQVEDEVSIGDILIIPGGEKPRTALPSAPSQASISGSWFIPPTRGVVSQGLHWHNAVDVANSCGTPIYAAASGRVQRTGYHGIAGYYVRILHPNGVVTFYGHLSRIMVSPGQQVAQGATIGLMGTTGYSTGCHLHFEVRGAANPLSNFRFGHRF